MLRSKIQYISMDLPEILPQANGCLINTTQLTFQALLLPNNAQSTIFTSW